MGFLRRFAGAGSLVRRHKFALLNDFAVESNLHFTGRSAGWQAEPFSKRVEPQKVAMAAGGRAGADVSDFAGVVAALESGVGELFPPGDVFVDAIDGSRDVIEEPVGKAVAARRVGIVKDQDKEFGFLGRAFPGK